MYISTFEEGYIHITYTLKSKMKFLAWTKHLTFTTHKTAGPLRGGFPRKAEDF